MCWVSILKFKLFPFPNSHWVHLNNKKKKQTLQTATFYSENGKWSTAITVSSAAASLLSAPAVFGVV